MSDIDFQIMITKALTAPNATPETVGKLIGTKPANITSWSQGQRLPWRGIRGAIQNLLTQ